MIGAGLIGASVGLALRRAGVTVLLADRDPERARLAAVIGAGVDDDGAAVDLNVVATPPREAGAAISAVLATDLNCTVTDCSSVKSLPLREVEPNGIERYVGGHPIAGRERAGPAAGRADLFTGRPWVVTPHPKSAAPAVDAVSGLARLCGAVPVVTTPDEHDHLLAVLSHLPQLAASALAAHVGTLPDSAISLAGQGLLDMTRIADSPADLWAEIAVANSEPVADALSALAARMTSVAASLRDPTLTPGERQAAVAELVRSGGIARSRLPGKHGGPQPDVVVVAVAVPDAPGELARLFATVGAADVNVEDFTVEHEPGRPVGIVQLAVRPAAAPRLRARLTDDDWSIYR